MKKRHIFCFGASALFLVLLFCDGQSVQAQTNYWNFGQPPALSPYLALGNRREGVLDNYSQFVRPRLEVQNMMNQQQAQINRQAVSQQMTQQILQRGGGGSSTMPAKTGRVSQAATFQNYSHYYRK